MSSCPTSSCQATRAPCTRTLRAAAISHAESDYATLCATCATDLDNDTLQGQARHNDRRQALGAHAVVDFEKVERVVHHAGR